MLVKNLKLSCFGRKGARYHWCLFGNAWVFLTRFPFPFNISYHHRLLNRASVYFPVVGMLLGILGVAVLFLALALFKSELLAVISLILFSVYATGAFHEDGFADCCDALGGGYSKQQVLEIMKDSRLGTYGTIGLIGVLAVKLSALWQIAINSTAVCCSVYVIAQAFSRWLPLLMIRYMEYVRFEGKAKPVAKGVSFKGLVCSLVFTLILALAILPISGLSLFVCFTMLLSGLLSAAFIAGKLKKAVGGYTGDGLGAAQQFSEVVMYLSIVATLAQ